MSSEVEQMGLGALATGRRGSRGLSFTDGFMAHGLRLGCCCKVAGWFAWPGVEPS